MSEAAGWRIATIEHRLKAGDAVGTACAIAAGEGVDPAMDGHDGLSKIVRVISTEPAQAHRY